MNTCKLPKNNPSTVVKWVVAAILIISNGIVFSGFSPVKAMPQTSLDSKTQQAMIDAINDEYRARAFYNAVMEKFGSVRPFSNIVQSENNHVNLWVNIFAKYGMAVPTDSFAGNVEVPDTLKAACQMGVEAEIDNVEMYDRFLGFVTQPDLKAAFAQLRQVSQERHLPAFERCQTQPNRGQGGFF
ncbi:exported hypothetical protein [Planktothrix serta PCC 8927]|uniref:DUF2202 domain-containing protein n=1 Tax=Planktothrix serta PCC 8927 TaxID=671068 RepID=A0A7Z9BHB4_9CYAN|nr:DUF2202 domain-containing protein [Planktothrix serta]VXD13662.1 exported hypothetical protein [Planktothrix serta PCC 8927]